jgi:hypothetical protein
MIDGKGFITEPASKYQWFIDDFRSAGTSISDSRSYTYSGPGQYVVKVTYPNGCSRSSDELDVDQCIFFPKTTGITVDGETLICTTPSSIVSSYTWYLDDVALPGTDSTIDVTSSGVFKVKVTYKDTTCSVTSDPVTVNGIGDEMPASYKVFPNPGDGNFWISSPTNGNVLRVTVFSSNGQIVHSADWDTMQLPLLSVNLTNASSGIYLVRLSDGNSYWSQRVIRR